MKEYRLKVEIAQHQLGDRHAPHALRRGCVPSPLLLSPIQMLC